MSEMGDTVEQIELIGLTTREFRSATKICKHCGRMIVRDGQLRPMPDGKHHYTHLTVVIEDDGTREIAALPWCMKQPGTPKLAEPME